VLQDGSKAIFLSHKIPLHNRRGKIIGMAGISIDITERKQAESALKQAKEAAENVQQTKEAFLQNISHDLRTPFCGLLSMAQFLEQQEEDAEKRKYLQIIAESAQALLNHINDILTYVNYAANTPVVDKAFKLPQLLQEVCAIVKPEAHLKALDFSCDITSDIPEIVRGDRLRLQHILLHLLANAIKFTPCGYVHLQAKLQANQEKQWLIQLTVVDNGIGIPEDKREVIFEPFHRLTPVPRALFTGKGLGLSIVKQFLDELGGEVQVTGAIGQGTIFTLLIPFKKPLSPNSEYFL
jgi:two-component system aerobic respiration control sensor histidine kinase ArcB